VAETYKILGQADPLAATPTDLYVVPGATSAVISSIIACNRGSATIQIRIWGAIAGIATANKQYWFFDLAVLKRSSLPIVLGVTLAATDVIRVQTDIATASFNVFGAEIT